MTRLAHASIAFGSILLGVGCFFASKGWGGPMAPTLVIAVVAIAAGWIAGTGEHR